MEKDNFVLMVGDTHGSLSWMKHAISVAKEKGCKRILQVGDFGFWEHTKDGKAFLSNTSKELIKNDIPLYWIDGNHENHELLALYKPQKDGFVKIRKNLFYAPRGHRWEWSGVKFLALGGAASIDRGSRIVGSSWWPGETITMKDVYKCMDGGPTDILITHDCPSGVPFTSDYPYDMDSNNNRLAIRAVVEEVKAKLLVHGHYHFYHNTVLELNGGVCRIVGLDRDGSPKSLAVLDLKEFQKTQNLFELE